jgi:hypothetical protein
MFQPTRKPVGEISMMLFMILFMITAGPDAFAAGAPKKTLRTQPAPFVSLMDGSAWQLMKAYRSAGPWKCTDSLFEGSDGWITHNAVAGDFVLEGEFLYNGASQGGVMIRGDAEAWVPWLHGYEMDIDEDMPGTGHIHFPYRPQPNPGVVQFPANTWQRFSIRAVGQDISVALNGKDVIKFRDDHYRYGVIGLEGERGGLKYRNLRVQKLDKSPPSPPRSPYIEIFDSAAPPDIKTEGTVAFADGVFKIDGSVQAASIRFPLSMPPGVIELDVWCKRAKGSSVSYRIGFTPGDPGAGPCFTCRNNRIQSCGTGRCTSQFPMFMETTCPEEWRFEFGGKRVEAFRFGEKVMTCLDTVPNGAGVIIAADSCVAMVRGARIKK